MFKNNRNVQVFQLPVIVIITLFFVGEEIFSSEMF